jgi:hypothetical protein
LANALHPNGSTVAENIGEIPDEFLFGALRIAY